MGPDNRSEHTESERTLMAVLILAFVVTIITGTHYFGWNLTRPVWLVLFILSVLALLLVLLAYRTLGL